MSWRPPLFPASPLRLVLLGIIFHLVYLMAMFDTYFHSPIVPIDKHYNLEAPLADRVVLIVADGLRADLLYTPHAFDHLKSPDAPSDGIVAPHLRSIIQEQGSYGLSMTRVPTESRPGHVAIIAGIWEDPSAVFKGWKHNPVTFDSVFNHSRTTFSFGSPDILPIFADPPRTSAKECLTIEQDPFLCSGIEDDPVDQDRQVLMWMYNPDAEDFTADTTKLDYFVLSKLRALFERARTDAALDARLRHPQTFFFLHLLGLDSSGHGWGPHSVEYMRNIMVVDGIVKEVEKLFADFYQDSRSAFVFTADHGMSNIGNHGDGHPDNTRTPYIAWGSGLRGPQIEDKDVPTHDEVSAPWQLQDFARRDLDQVDLNALMTALGADAWSANAVGSLPTSLLSDPSLELRARLQLGRTQALLQHLRIKHDLKAQHRLWMRPYPQLPDLGHTHLARARALMDARRYARAGHELGLLAAHAIDGLTYYDTYDRRSLQAIVGIGYASFGLYILAYTPRAASRKSIDAATLAALLAFAVLSIYQRTPWHLLYVAFPAFFIRGCLTTYRFRLPSTNILIQSAASLAALAILQRGYAARSVWTYAFLAMAGYLPTGLPWIASCISASYWTTLPVERSESSNLILLGGFGFAAFSLVYSKFCLRLSRRDGNLTMVLATLTLVTSLSATLTANALQAKRGLSTLAQISNWFLLFLSISAPFLTGLYRHQNLRFRLLTYATSCASAFSLLTVSWEILFLLNFTILLFAWIHGETRGTHFNGLRELLFLTLVHCAFFGTGNVASIASFYLGPVYRLVPVFSPVLMAILLMFKIIVPFLLLAGAFALVTRMQGTPTYKPILLMLAMTERESTIWRPLSESDPDNPQLCVSSSFCRFRPQALGWRLDPQYPITRLSRS